MRLVLLLLAGLAAAAAGAAGDTYRSCTGQDLSAAAARLAPCPNRPNCITSEATTGQQPLRSGAGRAGRERLKQAILAEPRSRIELDSPSFIVASFKSAIFGFVDEAQFILSADGQIGFRSGACSGHYDFGVNRRRIERIRQRLASSSEQPPS